MELNQQMMPRSAGVWMSVLLLLSPCLPLDCFDRCPGKEVATIQQQSERYELSAVLYYATWSSDSRTAKAIFDELAAYYNDYVYFAAVDCWHLACNCTQIYKTKRYGIAAPKKRPTTMSLRFGQNVSLHYTGDWSLPSVSRFLSNFLTPIDRIYSSNELKILLMRSYAVVLGLFSHPNCIEYEKFTIAAVKCLENDPERSFRFVAAFGSAAEDIIETMNVKIPIVFLINSGSGMNAMNFSAKWNASQIVLRVMSEMRRTIIQPINAYSTPLTIAMQIHVRPVLTIVVNDLDYANNFYTIMEDIIGTSSNVLHTTNKLSDYDKTYVITKGNYPAEITSVKQRQNEEDQSNKHCYNVEYLSIHNFQYYYFINNYLNNLFSNLKSNSISDIQDTLSSTNLLKIHSFHKSLISIYYNSPEAKISIGKFLKKFADNQWQKAFQRHNQTLSIVILDTSQHKDFLSIHGIVNSNLNAAVVLIADPRKENIFVMQERFTYDGLLQFIEKYYENNLTAALRSSNYFENVPSSLNAVYINNYNRQMFLNAIKEENRTSVVLLYSPECAFSTIFSHTLIQLKGLLHTNEINFIRLNAKSNDLPWEFVMPNTPSLIVFPRGHSMDSRIFPMHLKVNVRNVFGFILAQMEPVEQVKLVLSSCREILIPQRLSKCLQYAKKLAMNHISNHLKYWQLFEQERIFILNRLKQFKDMTLTIQRSFQL